MDKSFTGTIREYLGETKQVNNWYIFQLMVEKYKLSFLLRADLNTF